jgi:hypothetical protein
MGAFDDLIPQNATPGAAPPPAPRLGLFDDLIPRQRRASGVLEAIEAGFQGSATGLIARNKLPDVVLDPSHSAWYERALSSATGMVADLPEMILGAPAGAAAGGALGSAGGPVGAAIGSVVGGGAGAFAVPAAIREAYTQALTRGEITSASDFLDRAAIVLKTAGKEGLVGGLTFGAGGLAARTAGRVIAPAIGETLSVPAARAAIGTAGTGAELGTMVVAPAALEGKLPEPEDFLNAAIVLGGMKGAHVIAGKLRDIYAQTGVPPERVVGDAARDPSIKDDLLGKQPSEFSGTLAGLHGTVEPLENVKPQTDVFDNEDSVWGHAFYMAEPSHFGWFRGGNIRMPDYNHALTTEATFQKAAVLTPDNAVDFLKGLGAKDLQTPEALARLLRSHGYDGVIVRGFADPKAAEIHDGEIVDPADVLVQKLMDAGIVTERFKSDGPSAFMDQMVHFEPHTGVKITGTDPTLQPLLQQRAELVNQMEAEAHAVDPEGNFYTAGGKVKGATNIVRRVEAHDPDSEFFNGDPSEENRQLNYDYERRQAGDRYETARALLDKLKPQQDQLDQLNRQIDEAAHQPRGAPGPLEPVRRESDLPGAYQPLADAERGREIVPGEKAYDVSTSPFAQEVPQAEGEPAQPTHVNYNRINSHEDVKLALARVSEIYEAEIQQQRRGTVDWAQTSAETAQMLADTMGGTDPTLLLPREPGTPAGAAELLARKQMVVGAAEAMMAARDELLAKGADATAEDHLKYLASIERLSMIQSEFLGARAEAGRALNILRNTAMDADRVRLIQDLIERYGKDPAKLATMMKEIDTVEGAAKMARELTKATTWEKIIEAWKAGLVSGPITQMANIMGNTTFMLVRPIVDSVAASFGMFRTAADRVTAMEPAARVFGNLQGVMDGARVAAAMFRVGEDVMGKAEQYRQAIGGPVGAVVQLPFRALSAADAFFRTMNERGEAYSLATREATAEGFNPLTREFLERVARLVSNPTEEMQAQIAAAGDRFTFNTPLGEFGKSVQNMIRKGHLELLMPFVRTPVNIFKEMTRTSVFAPVMGEWRAAFEKGGAARDQALAEWAVGTGLMGATAALTLSGTVSGAGSPDPGKRQVKQAAGWQPYSVKIGDTWYSYQRLQPVGTLVGLAADLAETWDHVTPEESDKVPKMLAVAFANAVTNQTFLQGITTIVNVTSDPDRYGPRFFEAFAGSVVPGVVAQPAQMMDPVARRVDSMLDAIKSRIPGVRESLLPQRDVFGEPVQAKERFGAVLPITKSTESIDKVRTEAARLDVSAAATPKKTHIGRGSGKLGDVKLTPEQQDTFARVGGLLAHEILAPVVDAPGWDELPDLVQRRVYAKAFASAHRHAAIAALPPEERGPLIQQLTEKIQSELETE